MRTEQDQRSMESDAVTVLAPFIWAIHCVSFTQELFVRRPGTMGRGYPSWAVAFGGTFMVPLAAMAFSPPQYGIEFLQPYLWLVMGLSLTHSVLKWRNRSHVHSHFVGEPWLRSLGHRRSDFLIGLGVAAVGFAFCNTLGVLHLVGLIAGQMSIDLTAERDRRIVEQMKDAQLDAEYHHRLMNPK